MLGVIMAGGFGTRLRPVTCNMPKPMVPVANRPMMEYVVEVLKNAGITDQVSILYYQPESISDYFKDGSENGVKMRYARAMTDLGTAGAVRFATEGYKKPFVVISGDVVTDFDLTKALKFHKKKKAGVTICLTRVANPLAFGIVITDDKGRIQKFLEKPSWGEVFSDTINTGIYIIEPEIMDMIPPDCPYDFSKDLFPKLMAENVPLYGYIAEGYWKDVGNVVEYRKVQQDILSGKVKLKISEKKQDTIGYDLWLGKDVEFDDKARIEGGVIIGDNCRIGRCSLTNCVIGDNCIIDDNAEITNVVMWNDCIIGRGAQLSNDIIGKKAVVQDNAYVAEEVVISDCCRIGEGASIKANIKMWPHKVVESGATLSHSLIWGEKWNKELFGASGISGLANHEISPEFAAKIGATFGAMLGSGHNVVSSRDNHKACRHINRAIISGFLSVGVNVHDLQDLPVPVSRYQISQNSYSGGIHTRKVCFDPDRLHLMFFDDSGCDLPLSKQQAIERLFFREDFSRANIEDTGDLTFPHRVVDYYREGLFNFVDNDTIKKSKLKLVIDYSSGNSASIFPGILGSMNCDVIGLNANMDSNRLSKTEKDFREALQQLAFIVRSLKADMGIMLDTAGEKVFLVDEKGHIMTDEETLSALCVLKFQTTDNSRIAVPVTMTRKLEEVAEKLGGSILRTKTSPHEMMKVARNQEADIVAGGDGGFIFPSFQPYFDGMATVSKLIELMSINTGTHLGDILKKLPRSTRECIDVPCSFDMKGTVMRKIIEETKNKKISTTDGITIEHSNGWVLLLPDADRPFFHVTAEFSTRKKSQEQMNYWAKLIRDWQLS